LHLDVSVHLFTEIFLSLRDLNIVLELAKELKIVVLNGDVANHGEKLVTKWLIHHGKLLLVERLRLLIVLDLDLQGQQDVLQEFDFRVDPLEDDSDLSHTRARWPQIVQTILLHLIDLAVLVGLGSHEGID